MADRNWLIKTKFKNLLVDWVRNGIYKPPEFHWRWTGIINMGELFKFPVISRDINLKKVAVSDDELERFSLESWDLLFARRSLTTEWAWKVSYISSLEDSTVFESSIIRARPNKDIVEGKYLYYYFNSLIGKNAIRSIVREVAVAWITWSDLLEIDVIVPGIEEQKNIIETLSYFDDKIELLRKQNETLEKIASALYQNWFIEYAPFKKDLMEGESGSLIRGDKDARLVPRWWKIGKLGDIAEITSWKRPSEISEDKTDMFQYPLIGATKIMGYVADYLFEWETLVIGRVWTHGEIQRFNERIHPSDNTLVIKSRFFIFTYFILKDVDYQKMNRWAVQPLITQTDLRNQKIVIPPETVMDSFISTTNPIYEKISQNLKQMRTLGNIRDSILPKLMNGSLRPEYN